MKNKITFVATSDARALPFDETTTPVSISPYKSVFRHLHDIFRSNSEIYHCGEDGTEVTIACNGSSYCWDYSAATECFDKHLISEEEFAKRCLIKK